MFPLAAPHLLCGSLFCMPNLPAWGWSRGVAAQSGATATLAPATWYMIAHHRHAPSKHNITAALIRDYDPGCLPTFDIAGRTSLSVPADAVLTNHIGFEDTSHILLNLRICFSSQPWESKPQSFFFTTSEHNSCTVTTEGWTLVCVFVQPCVLLCWCAEQLEAGVNLPLSTV